MDIKPDASPAPAGGTLQQRTAHLREIWNRLPATVSAFAPRRLVPAA